MNWKTGFYWPIGVLGLYNTYSSPSYLQKTCHDDSTSTCTLSITESLNQKSCSNNTILNHASTPSKHQSSQSRWFIPYILCISSKSVTAYHTASFINKKYSINQLLCNLFHCQFQPHIELQKSTVIYISFWHCYNLCSKLCVKCIPELSQWCLLCNNGGIFSLQPGSPNRKLMDDRRYVDCKWILII